MKNLRQVEVTIKHIEFNFDTQQNEDKGDEILLGCFHEWENYVHGSDYSKKYAIVELENGQIQKYEPEQIKFTGKPCGAALFEDELDEEIKIYND